MARDDRRPNRRCSCRVPNVPVQSNSRALTDTGLRLIAVFEASKGLLVLLAGLGLLSLLHRDAEAADSPPPPVWCVVAGSSRCNRPRSVGPCLRGAGLRRPQVRRSVWTMASARLGTVARAALWNSLSAMGAPRCRSPPDRGSLCACFDQRCLNCVPSSDPSTFAWAKTKAGRLMNWAGVGNAFLHRK
jgi:hypothetical protein